jgi:hypothetical protein
MIPIDLFYLFLYFTHHLLPKKSQLNCLFFINFSVEMNIPIQVDA